VTEDPRVVGSNSERNLQAIFDPGLPIQQIFPSQIKVCLYIKINFAGLYYKFIKESLKPQNLESEPWPLRACISFKDLHFPQAKLEIAKFYLKLYPNHFYM